MSWDWLQILPNNPIIEIKSALPVTVNYSLDFTCLSEGCTTQDGVLHIWEHITSVIKHECWLCVSRNVLSYFLEISELSNQSLFKLPGLLENNLVSPSEHKRSLKETSEESYCQVWCVSARPTLFFVIIIIIVLFYILKNVYLTRNKTTYSKTQTGAAATAL